MSAGACVALGGLFARRTAEKDRLIQAWSAALLRMEDALDRGDSLPQVLETGGNHQLPLLQTAADMLRAGPALGPEEWLAALPWEDLLDPSERDTLATLLRSLWTPSPAAQLRALHTAQSQWAAIAAASRAKRETNGRLYARLGWLGGAALFILMC